MKLATATVTKTAICTRCKGVGYGDWYPDAGRCWGGCNATGIVATGWEGADVYSVGLVARPAQLERGTAKVREILMLISQEQGKNGAYRMSVYTIRLDGSIHYWTTTDPKKGMAAAHRAGQALQRDMTEERMTQLISELHLFPKNGEQAA